MLVGEEVYWRVGNIGDGKGFLERGFIGEGNLVETGAYWRGLLESGKY